MSYTQSLTHSGGEAGGYIRQSRNRGRERKGADNENITKERERVFGLSLDRGAVHYFCWTGHAHRPAADLNGKRDYMPCFGYPLSC